MRPCHVVRPSYPQCGGWSRYPGWRSSLLHQGRDDHEKYYETTQSDSNPHQQFSAWIIADIADYASLYYVLGSLNAFGRFHNDNHTPFLL
jgi:hypothetical protein